MERLGVQRAGDEELLAFVENDACGADGIQVMTGCTFGKGNFIFKNFGKHAFTLVARKRGKSSVYASGLMRLRLPPSTISSPKGPEG
jgi:formylmethanofuran dehydrogenase subunit E